MYRSEKNDDDKDEYSCDDEHDDAEDSSIAELGKKIWELLNIPCLNYDMSINLDYIFVQYNHLKNPPMTGIFPNVPEQKSK